MKNLKLYDDIINQYKEINAWSDEACFPVNHVNKYEKNKLKDIIVAEIIFPGHQGNKNLIEELFKKFDSFLKKYFLSSKLPIYIFQIEHIKKTKSRIRSYKGLLSRELNRKDFIEVEFDLPGNYSVISGISRLTEDNASILLSSIFDSTNCFIISTNENIFSWDFLLNMCKNHIVSRGNIIINYLRLCLQYCHNNNAIYRVGGDGGDQEVNLQIFTAKNQKEMIIENIKRNYDPDELY